MRSALLLLPAVIRSGYRSVAEDGGRSWGIFSDLRDLEFDLFEVFRVQDEPATTDVDTDPDTLRGVLRELDALATGPLAEGFAEADRHPPTFDPRRTR